MIADRARNQDRIAWPRPTPGQFASRRDDANASGRDEQAITLPALDDFGVAGNDRDTGGFRRFGHTAHDALKIGDFEPFFDDEGSR